MDTSAWRSAKPGQWLSGQTSRRRHHRSPAEQLQLNSYNTSDDTLTGTAIHLAREGGVRDLTWTGLYFEVYDIPRVCLRVEEGGGRILNPPRRARDGTIVADLADPEGNVFIFYSPLE